ncbi:MAG: 4Fe-4S binding protein [Candidatus Bathyarchaeota archaeon]|nr:MAG: 4Fe-4S binding protein [Candidatus Bathyarchaeota archaeon]
MVRLLLRFSEKVVGQPITAEIILEQGVPVNILGAQINQLGGEILAEIPSAHLDKIVKAFRERGVTVTVRKLIEVNSDKCFDCGSCFSLCPVNAITLEEDFSVVFDEGKCIGSTCGLCADACPAKAIKLTR